MLSSSLRTYLIKRPAYLLELPPCRAKVTSPKQVVVIELMVRIVQRLPVQEPFVLRDDGPVPGNIFVVLRTKGGGSYAWRYEVLTHSTFGVGPNRGSF